MKWPEVRTIQAWKEAREAEYEIRFPSGAKILAGGLVERYQGMWDEVRLGMMNGTARHSELREFDHRQFRAWKAQRQKKTLSARIREFIERWFG